MFVVAPGQMGLWVSENMFRAEAGTFKTSRA